MIVILNTDSSIVMETRVTAYIYNKETRKIKITFVEEATSTAEKEVIRSKEIENVKHITVKGWAGEEISNLDVTEEYADGQEV